MTYEQWHTQVLWHKNNVCHRKMSCIWQIWSVYDILKCMSWILVIIQEKIKTRSMLFLCMSSLKILCPFYFLRIRLLIPFSLDIPLNHISTRVAPLFSKKRHQNSVPFFSAEYDLRVHLKWRVRRPSRCSYASLRHIISFSKNIEQSSIKMKTRLKGREQALKDRNEIQSTWRWTSPERSEPDSFNRKFSWFRMKGWSTSRLYIMFPNPFALTERLEHWRCRGDWWGSRIWGRLWRIEGWLF